MSNQAVSVVHEDNHVLALDKPAGLLTQSADRGDDNLLDRAKEYIRARYNKPGNVYLGLVHRLDRNVSGVVILARTSKAAARLSAAFASRHVDKRYWALVVGAAPEHRELRHRLGPRPGGQRGVCEQPDGKEAVLELWCRATSNGTSLVEVRLHTGRKHQVRAQLALARLPVLGDPLYGARSRSPGRPALHAARLRLAAPVGQGSLDLVAPWPRDLRRAMDAKLFDAVPHWLSP